MLYVIILLTIITLLILLKLLINTRIKDIKNLAENKQLNDITNKFPENTEICKKILKNLKNEEVNIKENTENKSSFYFILTNTINIANIKESYTRIQTIAHECIHSIQDKRLLWFNYIFSNIYLIFFIVICLLEVFNNTDLSLFYTSILLSLTCIWVFVRIFLETDAMTRARYIAETYMKEENIVKTDDIDKVINEYERLNNIGIKLANYQILLSGMLKVLIFLCITILVKI